MSRHSVPRLLVVCCLLLPFTILLTPTLIAQGNSEPPWNPVPVSPPAMIYQPPPDADDLNDFLPPGYTYVNATTIPTPTIPSTLTLPPSLPGGGHGPLATLTAPPATVILPPGTATPGEPTSLPTGTVPATVTPPPNSTVITLPQQGGGILFAQQQVAVVVEDPTFNQTTNFTFSDIPAPVYPITLTNTISNLAHTRTLLSFQLETATTTGTVISTFSHPVRLIVDMRDLTPELNPVYSDYWLAYRDPTDPNVWHEVPISVHQPDGLISAEVQHFSEWASGVRPQRWNPSWNPPAVSEFSGAATFSYPLDVPLGRHGLQPAVALSYSSRGLDGRIQDGDQGAVADGWSLAEISIVREDVRLKNDTGIPYTHMQHRFRLVLNGTGHQLIAGGTPKWGGTRFYAVDAPDIYIELHDTTSQNGYRQRLFWSVITADGVYYRLGYQEYAEESQEVENPARLVLEGDSPVLNPTWAGIAWHVDLVADPYGNRMTYTYFTNEAAETIDYYSNGWHDYLLTTHFNRIATINYNYEDRATSLPPGPQTLYPTGTPGSRIVFHARYEDIWWNATDPVTNIFIYHGNMSTPIKEYRLVVVGDGVQSNACRNEDVVPDIPRVSVTHKLKEIWLFTGTNDDLDDNDPGYALPPVTLDYDYKPHFLEDDSPCFSFYYLTGYHNGYGGSVTFTYTSDNRQVGDYTTPNESCNTNWPHEYPWDYPEDCWLPYGQYEWPDIGYNYFVTAVTQNDGRDISPPIATDTTTTYSYATPCYYQASNDPAKLGDLEGAHRCSMPDGEWDHLPEVSNLTGFAVTTVIQKGFSDEYLSQRVTTFSQDYHHSGQAAESWGYVWNSSLSQFQLVQKTLNTLTYQSLGGSLYFSYVSESKSYQYDLTDSNNYMATKQVNQYATADQGGQQWGRLTQQDLYYWSNGQWNFQQQQLIRYRTRTDSSGNYWLIVPYLQGVYETGGTARQLTLLYYDGATNNPETQTLDKGALTLSRSVLINSPIPGTSNHWYTSDTRFTYDDATGFGNQTQIKTNPAYGEVGWSGSAWNYSVLPNSSTEQITSISYESTYHLYPISVKQEGAAGTSDDLTTSFQIYGFNGVALDGWQEQTGLVKQVTNPNGTIVIYEYDPFGRLVATYENSTDRGTISQYLDGDPLTRYRYWDNGWNQSILQGEETIPVDYLNPENNDPFMITTQTRPGSYNTTTPGYEFRTQTFFDGLGRVIQEQNTYQEVHDPDAGTLLQKDVVTTTRYNSLGLTDCQTTPYAVDLYNQRATFPANPYVPGECTSYSRTTTTYDNLGRPLTVTSPGGDVSTYAYGLATGITVNGHNRLAITRIQDANNHLVRHYTNVLGQLALVREYKGIYLNETDYADTRYEYDTLGNLVRVGTSTPSASQPTSWLRFSSMSYDALGRKLDMTDPDMGYWAYTYDALGNLLTQDANPGVSADRNVLCFTYDSFNRLTHKRQDNPVNGCSSGDTLLASTSYYIAGSGGATGQVQEVKWPDNSNRETFSYNSLGLLTSHSRWIGSNVYITGYGSFDKLNRPQTITYPNSESVTMTYDHEGDKTLSAGGTPLVSDIWYNKRGQMTALYRGNNVRTTYDYADASGDFRLENAYTRRYVYPFTTDLLDFDYTYDAVGNVDTVFEDVSNDSQWFDYDELNRLTDAYATSGVANYDHEYTYDELGNLQSRKETVGGTPTTYDLLYPTGNNPTRPDAVTSVKVGALTVASFSYDSHGNMINRVENGVTYTQTFDGENRLITVTLSSGTPLTTTFRYDAGGQRTQTMSYTDSDHRTVTDYPFPHYEVERVQQWEFCEGCAEGGVWLWVTTATTTRSTYFLAGQAIATRVNGTIYHLHGDHLGSTSLMTNSSGYSQSGTAARYLPYGGYRTTPTANLTELGYTGHHDNPEIKLIYMNARFYSPYLNRFISADSIVPDPANPQSANRYTYVLGNPLRYTDPTGHCLADDNNSEFCDPIDYGYLRARQVAIEWLLDELRQPFQEDPPVNRGFSSTHNGVDFGGDITVTAPASGTVTEAGPDGPAGMWKLERLNEDGECCVPGATREWSVFETATDDPLYESDRGEDGLLEPERLLASGEWVEATDATGWSHTQGTVIVVQHEHNLETVYYHTIPSVQTGTTVNQGDVLGQTTNNGWSSGTHLHYSIRFTYNGESEWLDLTVLGLDQ